MSPTAPPEAPNPNAAGPDAGPPRRYEGLLTQVMATPLDADYEVVARRRGTAPASPSRSRARIAFWCVVLAFGAMVGVSALKTQQDRPIAEAERTELIDQIHHRQGVLDSLHDRVTTLQRIVTSSQATLADDLGDDEKLTDRLSLLGGIAGSTAVTGPGVTITVDDAPDAAGGSNGIILDSDLQLLVNGLWKAGAEAISIDGHRLTSLTSIRFAGRAITVDYRSLTPPYTIDAIGDPDQLPAKLADTSGGQIWTGLANNLGIRYDVVPHDDLTLPADPREHLLYAQATGAAR